MVSVSQRIKAYNDGLLPAMVSRKYKLMSDDFFRFYRGTAHLFYEDLHQFSALPASPNVWLSGDLHLENFGSYKGDNRLVYFDISDFDEGLLGPALLEITSMITSIFVGFKVLDFSDNSAEDLAKAYLKKYAETLAHGKAKHIELQTANGIVKDLLGKVSEREVEKWLQKRIEKNDKGELVFRELKDKQLEIKQNELKKELTDHIAGLSLHKNKDLDEFTVLDCCFRMAGTGSLGLKRYLFLIRTKQDKDLWLLDMKQARESSISPYVEVIQPSWQTEAERITTIKFMMQDVPEALLTTTIFKGDSYLIQEMQPTEDKIEFKDISKKLNHVFDVMDDMALLSASAQLRSAGRKGSATADELIAFGKTDLWHKDILAWCKNYGHQVKQDYKQYAVDYGNHLFD